VFYVADNYRANSQCHASHGIDSFVINVVLSHFFLTMTAVAAIGKFYWQQKINSKLEIPSTGTHNYESRRTPSLPVSRYGAVWVCSLNLKRCLKSSIRTRSVVKAMFGKSGKYLCARVRSPEVIKQMMTNTAHSSVSLSHTT